MKTIFCITGLAIQGLAMSVQAQTGKPNIVVIMTDQQRADLCGREGFLLEVTPFVDRLAQENVWFNKAYTVMPARLSGTLFHVHRAFSFRHSRTHESQYPRHLLSTGLSGRIERKRI